jgi:hypothetical protein
MEEQFEHDRRTNEGETTMAMKTTLEIITPERAREYLGRNLNNRRIRKPSVACLARAIRQDEWQLTHQGIAFNCDGSLIDGQHRLLAIIEANKAVPMYVTRGAPKDTVRVIDAGTIRDDTDAANVSGLPEVTRNQVAIARRMKGGADFQFNLKFTRGEMLDFIREHLAAIQFASVGGGGHTNSVVRSVVGRAWYSVNRDRLRQFMEVLASGEMEGKADLAAISLRDQIIKSAKNYVTGDGRCVLYRKTETALRAFVERRPLKVLAESKVERFPLPGEQVAPEQEDLF